MSTTRLIGTTVGMVVLYAGSVAAQPAQDRRPVPPALPDVSLDAGALSDDMERALDEVERHLDGLTIPSFDEPLDLALLMPSMDRARAHAKAQAEAARERAEAQAEAARAQAEAQAEAARAQAEAVRSQMEAQAEAMRAQLDARVNHDMGFGVFSYLDGDIEYARAINALDRGLYEEALSRLKELSAKRAKRTEESRGPHPMSVKGARHGPDAISYWQAYAEYKLGRAKEALETLSAFSKTWPNSGWRNDARALEIEIRQSSGQPVAPDTIEDAELKLLALQGLLRAGRSEAMPALERMVLGVNPPRVKQRAMFVLAQHPSPKAQDVMLKVIKGGANPDVQLVAVRYLTAIGPNDEDLLVEAYKSASDKRVKEAVISRLAAKQRAKALVSVARQETDANLKKRIVERLATMKSKEATDYLLEIVNK